MVVTIIIIIITVLASRYAWSNQSILYRWIFNPYNIVQKKQYDRFITSGFIHNDTTHLVFNMFTFFFFGAKVEQYLQYYFGGVIGIVLYIALYLLSIIVSDIPTFIKYKDKPHYNSLGASGGVSGIVFAGIAFEPVGEICLYVIFCLEGFILGALYLIYSYYKSKQPGSDNINHDAHLYGAVFGFVITLLIVPDAISMFWGQIAAWDGKLLDGFGR